MGRLEKPPTPVELQRTLVAKNFVPCLLPEIALAIVGSATIAAIAVALDARSTAQ